MTTTSIRTTATTTSSTSHRWNRRTVFLWTIQILLAAFFLIAATPKLAGQHDAVRMFGQIGAGQWLRYLVGAAELAGAIGLLIPRLAVAAALGLAADMAGATIINAAILHSGAVVMTVPLCIVFVLLARARLRPIA
jgi:putative oxidoreductase